MRFFSGFIGKDKNSALINEFQYIAERFYKKFKTSFPKPKFSDGQVLAYSTDPDQTAPTLFAIPPASSGCITLL